MRRLLPVALAALSLTACVGDILGGGCDDTVIGTYYLGEVNNTTLPYILVTTDAEKLEIVTDQIILRAGNTYDEVGSFRSTKNGIVTTRPGISDDGGYTVANKTVSFTSRVNGAAYSGTLNSNNSNLTVSVRSAGPPLAPLPPFAPGAPALKLTYAKNCYPVFTSS